MSILFKWIYCFLRNSSQRIKKHTSLETKNIRNYALTDDCHKFLSNIFLQKTCFWMLPKMLRHCYRFKFRKDGDYRYWKTVMFSIFFPKTFYYAFSYRKEISISKCKMMQTLSFKADLAHFIKLPIWQKVLYPLILRCFPHIQHIIYNQNHVLPWVPLEHCKHRNNKHFYLAESWLSTTRRGCWN